MVPWSSVDMPQARCGKIHDVSAGVGIVTSFSAAVGNGNCSNLSWSPLNLLRCANRYIQSEKSQLVVDLKTAVHHDEHGRGS